MTAHRSAPSGSTSWARSPERAALLRVYAEVDTLFAGWTCECSRADVGETPNARCCHFAVTGREPYPTAIELTELQSALRAAPPPKTDPRRLPVADLRACPLLSPEGRCRAYASRPFGCRTFFCSHAEGPGGTGQKLPRDAVNALGRRVADLSARHAPRDPGPRPLVNALTARGR